MKKKLHPLTYSKLPKRQRIAADIEQTEKDISFYTEAENSYMIEELQSKLDHLKQKAAHYDREVSQGYKAPATLRNGKSKGA